jgi:RHS repeat-associated protein
MKLSAAVRSFFLDQALCAPNSKKEAFAGGIPPRYRSLLVEVIFISALTCSIASAQGYLSETGSPTFGATQAVESGFVNVSNGNLHLDIPFVALPQRGSTLFTAGMVYDSRIWQIVTQNGVMSWQPTNVPNSQGGWRFISTGNPGTGSYTATRRNCPDGSFMTNISGFTWTSPDGTKRKFPMGTALGDCNGGSGFPTNDAFASDSSGFHMYVTGGFLSKVYAPDGTLVSPTLKDVNGNFFSTDSNHNVIDTVGRTPVIATVNGNSTTYAILNSQGTISTVTVTTQTISVNTAFSVNNVKEFSGTMTVVQSIAFADGTAFHFTYDSGTGLGHYGALTAVTLPTGGQVSYGYGPILDSYGSKNWWVMSHTSGGGISTFTPTVITTCASGAAGCQQQVKVTKPSGDQAIYIFTLNNGAWLTQAQIYSGSATTANLVATQSTTYDFSQTCTCGGAMYIRPLKRTVSLTTVGGTSITRQTQYTYVSPQTGNISAIKEWAYRVGTSPVFPTAPDRETDFSYLTDPAYQAKNIINRSTSQIVRDGSGVQLALTTTTYDTGSITPASGIKNHDDTIYSGTYTTRGNPSAIQRWVGGTQYLLTTMAYDATGQIVQTTDPHLNTTTISYADNFYSDNSSNPPAAYTPSTATNAYQSSVTAPLIGTSTYGYYFGTGKRAFSVDANGASTYYHYVDPKDQLTATVFPMTVAGRSWAMTNYVSSTQQDYYGSIGDAQPSITCTSCRHDRTIVDGLGRPIKRTLVSDPQAMTSVDTVYDSTGRVQSVTNPYRSNTDPTYGTQAFAYDGMNRPTTVTQPDGSIKQFVYGAGVGSNGGNSSQICPTSVYGVGYPSLAIDEAGKKGQIWTDGFGRVIESDVSDGANNLAAATCSSYDLLNDRTQIVQQGSRTRSYAYDVLSRITSMTTPEAGTVTLYYTNTAGALCSGDSVAVCRRVDASNVITSYNYDAANRLVSRTFSDSTPTVSYFYDQASYNGLSITNGKGRRTGMADSSGTAAWSYDALGHVLTEKRTIGSVTKSFSYTYDLAGNVASIQYPSGNVVNFGYNNAKELVSETSADGINYASNAVYAPQGILSSVMHGQSATFPGILETFNFNNRLQVTGISASSQAGTALNLGYSFPSASNNNLAVTENNSRDNGRTQSWTYDFLNRLISAQSAATAGPDCWGQVLGYDSWANLLSETPSKCSSSSLSASVNAANQLTNTGFSYDPDGRLTNEGGTNPYTYDAENQIITAGGISYTYDGLGTRVKKSDGKVYWHDTLGNDLAETDLSGNTTAEYISFAGRLIGVRNGSSVNYYFSDRAANTRAITGATGIVCYDADFYPFGVELAFTSTCNPTFKFAGYERDSESGLDYSGMRFYNSRIGRFMTPDPVNASGETPQALNRYSYAFNDPVNVSDSRGRYPRDEHQYVTFIMGALIGRPDAATVAQGAGDADSIFNATTGLFGLGAVINFGQHFGVPCNMDNSCSSDSYQLGKDVHLVEDMSVGGPHDIVGGMSLISRVADEIAHIGLNLAGRSPDRDPTRSGGFRAAWGVMGGNPESYPVDAIEFIRNTVNDLGLTIVAARVTLPGQMPTATSGFPSDVAASATLVVSSVRDGITINIWQLPSSGSIFDDPGVQAIMTAYSLPGSDPAAEAEAIYNYLTGSPALGSSCGGTGWDCSMNDVKRPNSPNRHPTQYGGGGG